MYIDSADDGGNYLIWNLQCPILLQCPTHINIIILILVVITDFCDEIIQERLASFPFLVFGNLLIQSELILLDIYIGRWL